jgi:hypothetical protein
MSRVLPAGKSKGIYSGGNLGFIQIAGHRYRTHDYYRTIIKMGFLRLKLCMVLRANGFGLLFNVVGQRANPGAGRHHALPERLPCH